MNFAEAEKIATAVLYEGYMLYPYRATSLKNQQRWNFGTLYPPQFEEVRAGHESSSMHVECLLAGDEADSLEVRLRFLLQTDYSHGHDWAEMKEHVFDCCLSLCESESTSRFEIVRGHQTPCATVRLQVDRLAPALRKLKLDLTNDSTIPPSATRSEAASSSLVSAHLVLGVEKSEFISLLDPPNDLQAAVRDCKSQGCFPVLVGSAPARNMLLCAPIILYDYPQVAPESAGDFFDSTEMDEMLTLRTITLTEDEKSEARSQDDRARELLERTERMAREQLTKTHGTIRDLRPVVHDE